MPRFSETVTKGSIGGSHLRTVKRIFFLRTEAGLKFKEGSRLIYTSFSYKAGAGDDASTNERVFRHASSFGFRQLSFDTDNKDRCNIQKGSVAEHTQINKKSNRSNATRFGCTASSFPNGDIRVMTGYDQSS